jgi:outer membrane protein OmpA-like peptidoglycan-associated protein
MKSAIQLIVIMFISFGFIKTYAQFDDLINKVKDKTEEKVEKKVEDDMDKDKETNKNKESPEDKNKENTSHNNTAPAKTIQLLDTKAYQNYDFVPGDRIIFEDNFSEDQAGEFPSHWDLLSGQAQISKIEGANTFALTEGNYVSVVPLLKTDTYLATDTFTVEFDFYTQPGAYNQVGIRFWNPKNSNQENGDGEGRAGEVFVGNSCSAGGLSGTYPVKDFNENKWHHIAIARKGNQLKIYEDQYRVLNVPVYKLKTYAVDFVGIGDQEKPIMLKNVRIAEGGNFNDTKHLLTQANSKIITHGILFDIDKATIKPESMGTINQIFNLLKDNPEIKFEIDGHTDNTGDSDHNKELSSLRAESVKSFLVNMGIAPSRLNTKGYGDSKPITDNTTFEGKANNRRVEFVRL